MIKVLIMDVDGTLTDGKIYMTSNGCEFKAFNVKDGYSIKHILPKLNILPVIITGRMSDIVQKRAEELNIVNIYQGIENKVEICNRMVSKLNISYKNVAFIGDDYNDIELMKLCGLKACPSDSIEEMKDIVDIVLERKGGDGAVYELIKTLREVNEKNNCIIAENEVAASKYFKVSSKL